MPTHQFIINVKAPHLVSRGRVLSLLRQLLDIGIHDAENTAANRDNENEDADIVASDDFDVEIAR